MITPQLPNQPNLMYTLGQCAERLHADFKDYTQCQRLTVEVASDQQMG